MNTQKDNYREFVEQFLRDLYMDDNITGFNEVTTGYNYYLFAKTIMMNAGFILRKWRSNSKELVRKINAYEEKHFNTELIVESVTKVLGVHWKIDSDMLFFDLSGVINDAIKAEVLSKRMVLKVVSSIFDPLGTPSPAVIILKIHFEEVCLMKIDWDIPLPVEFIVKWKHSLKLLAGLEPVYIMRNYLHGYQLTQSSKVELHGFCDASQKAAAAVVYFRAVLTDRILCSLVAAKTKVAPIEKKTLTIPKLELMSCLLLSRLLKSVIASLRDVYEISQVLC